MDLNNSKGLDIFNGKFMKVGYVIPLSISKNNTLNNKPFKFHILKNEEVHNEVLEYLLNLKNKYSQSSKYEILNSKNIFSDDFQDKKIEDNINKNLNQKLKLSYIESIRKNYYNEIDIKLLIILNILDLFYLINYFDFKNIKFFDFLLLNENIIKEFDIDIISKNRLLKFLNSFIYDKPVFIKIKDIFYFFQENKNLIFNMKSFYNLKNYLYNKNKEIFNNKNYYDRLFS